MSMVLPPPLLAGTGGPVLNGNHHHHHLAPPHQSPGTISRMAVQQQLLDNLTAELDRQASQRRTYRLPRDVVDAGSRSETDDMDWILKEKLKLHRVTANLRKKATSPMERAAVAKFDRHVNSVATEFRSRYATQLLRQSNNHKTAAERRVIQARYSTKPPLFAGASMPTRSNSRSITSLPLGGVRTLPVTASPNAASRFFNTTVPAGGSNQDNTWEKVIRPAGPCISRLKPDAGLGVGAAPAATAPRYDHQDVNMSRSASNRSTQASLCMSRSTSNAFDADVSLVDTCDALDQADDEAEVPHYVQDLIDNDLDYDDYSASSDVTSECDLMEVDQQADHQQPYESTLSAPAEDGSVQPSANTAQESVLALYRKTVPLTEPHVRAMCYWFAIHVVGRLAHPEPVRPGANGSSAEEWGMGSVIDRSAQRMSGSTNFEPKWHSAARSPTPVRPYRAHGRIPSDPYQVLNVHGSGSTIKPDPQFVNFLVHLIYEKEIAIETIIAAAWFVDGLSVHDVDGEFGSQLRQAMTFSNPGESFPVERRLVMIGLYLADMSVSDNYWSLSAWADACMVPRRQARLMEREALISLRHSITISPKAWLDHCSHVYSNVARLRIGDSGINWALLEVCHKTVTTARGIVDANEQADYQWTITRRNLDLHPAFDAIKAHRADTSRMTDDAWLDNVSDSAEGQVAQLVESEELESPSANSDQENVPPVDQDDDEYEEFDGAGRFPQPVFKPPFHQAVQPPAKIEVVKSDFSAPALEAALSLVAMNQDNEPAADDDDESDYEPYDGAGHFPMPTIQGKRVISTRSNPPAYTDNNTALRHPRAVPRSPVQLARVRPVLNRFETMAALMAEAPYRFPTPQAVNQQTVLAALSDETKVNTVPVDDHSPSSNTTPVHFYPTVNTGKKLAAAIPQYPVRAPADQLSVPRNTGWPTTNPLNMTLAAQPNAPRPPLGRLSPVAGHPGDVFPPVPIAARENSLLNRRYRHPGFFRERYVPPPTPVEQQRPSKGKNHFASAARFQSEKPFASPAAHACPPLSTNPLLSPSSECGATTPSTPHDNIQLWRRNVAALGCERPPSAMTCVSTTTCGDQNTMYWRYRDVMDDALAKGREFEGFLHTPPSRRQMPELAPGTVINLGA